MNEQRNRVAVAIADAIYALNAETLYNNGETTSSDFIKSAGDYLECGRPFGDGGDFVCPHCIGNSISNAIYGPG